ncbi:hypothetical protein QQ045_026472 [Rhodiola kirilowii]
MATQGGCCGLCDMGTRHLSFPGTFSGVSILQAHTSCYDLSMCHDVTPLVHENYQASEISQEKKTKDASSTVDVNLHHAADGLKRSIFVL